MDPSARGRRDEPRAFTPHGPAGPTHRNTAHGHIYRRQQALLKRKVRAPICRTERAVLGIPEPSPPPVHSSNRFTVKYALPFTLTSTSPVVGDDSSKRTRRFRIVVPLKDITPELGTRLALF